MLDAQTLMIALAIFAAFLCGKLGSRWYLPGAKRNRRWTPKGKFPAVSAPARAPAPPAADPADQLRIVMQSSFERRKLLSRNEARVFQQVEKAAHGTDRGWRVMAQVSLGEILKSPDPHAYSAINSKRVDILLISSDGTPIAAIEYQGSGHYLGTAAARDAVKREALRRAGIAFIEIRPDHGADDIAREIERLAQTKVTLAA